jgi:hypothetical protein
MKVVRTHDVVACIAGRGFKVVRRNDMRRPLLATGGKVFTLKSIEQHLVEHKRIKDFVNAVANRREDE